MAYAYWLQGRHEDHAAFELYFRRNPFDAEFTVFAGLGRVQDFLETFAFAPDDIDYLRCCPSPILDAQRSVCGTQSLAGHFWRPATTAKAQHNTPSHRAA
jgi:nicotinic acid phosphoribosyltransferase